jgi:uncharacterized protein YjbI with pentapeptide repeats
VVAIVLAGVALFVFFIVAIVFVPTWLAQGAFAGIPGTPTQEEWALRVSDERRSVLWMIGGLFAIVGLVYTALRHRLSQANHELQRDANRTDRYASAIEQLGSDKLDIRLGGIYALERIALDSERDRGPIGEVLSAFVREHARVPDEDVQFDELEKVSTDVQAVLTVLGRRPQDGTHPPVNFSGAGLARANLSGMNLYEANLMETDLRRASLPGAELTRARLFGANLQMADFRDANLTGAAFLSVNLNSAEMSGANLSGANLSGANLYGAILKDANLRNVDMSWADLTQAILIHANLTNADLTYATLTGTDLRRAILTDANLRLAVMEDCDLSDADLTRATLTGRGLNLVTFSEEQRAQANIGDGW